VPAHRNIRMDRPDLTGLPATVALPEGYRRLPYDEPLLPRWLDLLNHAFPESGPFTPDTWREQTTGRPQFRPDWVVLIERESDSVICATAFAWVDQPGERELGRVHWVAARKETRGLGLGRATTLLVLRELADAGFARAMLDTQAFRLPAIQLYLSLGFVPTPNGPEEEGIWRDVLGQLKG
jgi:GNAT superfamily N-acetyltransferase